MTRLKHAILRFLTWLFRERCPYDAPGCTGRTCDECVADWAVK